eukprot:6481570-Alexandrium_andersonii.AAC.1
MGERAACRSLLPPTRLLGRTRQLWRTAPLGQRRLAIAGVLQLRRGYGGLSTGCGLAPGSTLPAIRDHAPMGLGMAFFG